MPPDSPDFVDQLKASAAIEAARRRALAAPAKRRQETNASARDKWLTNAMHGVIDDVRAEKEGNRNGRLHWGARRLGEMAHGGLDEATCRRELERAAEDNGLWKEDGAGQCRSTIESGWRKGVAEPIDLSHIGVQQTGSATKAKPTAEQTKQNGHAAPETMERSLTLIRLDTIKTTVPQWVWEYGGRGRIQLGTLSIFAGKPAAGKSTAVRWFAARISRGELPGVWEGHPMRCCVLMMEEQLNAIVVPGLIAAGADRSNIYHPQFTFGGTESTMMSQADENRLTDMLVNNEVRALFIDPIMQTLGGRTDVYRANEVREAMAPFTRIAEAINGIVVGVSHLRKGEVKEVLGNINGSAAFGEIPRAVFGFSPMPDDDHVMEQVKNSAGQPGLKLAYNLPIHNILSDDGQLINLPKFEIKGETQTSISDIATNDGETTKIATACVWLQRYLEQEQPAPSSQVKRDAKAHGDISEQTIGRAAKRLGVVINVVSLPGKPYTTVWTLPGCEGLL